MNIVMLAAENGALPGGKVGGIGDVVRDVPPALIASDAAKSSTTQVQVVTPGYQAFSKLSGARLDRSLKLEFAGRAENVDIYEIPVAGADSRLRTWALEHPLFAAGGAGAIYCNDGADRPFATDASKFALFSIAAAEAVKAGVFGEVDVLHLHDWHAALVAVLRAFDPNYQSLQSIHTVYTIHNLALQGVRPLEGDPSSLESWYPQLKYQRTQINDPRVPHCINPMRAGINLSDSVHAVSPSYAEEILLPSDLSRGYFGGEGLEADLQRAAKEQRLHGILNGCEYPELPAAEFTLADFLTACEQQLLQWIGATASVDSAHLLAWHRLQQLVAQPDSCKGSSLISSVGRITDQKVRLLAQELDDGDSALQHVLSALGDQGLFVLLGSGDADYEQFLTRTASRNDNFLFLKGYSDQLAEGLYHGGDLFLMPSSFEPCGISQMLSMRAGQPCLVHHVGGLRDTVIDGKNGFAFSGDTLQAQAQNMVTSFVKALKTRKLKKWQTLCNNAAKARFRWEDAAAQYQQLLYK